MGVSGIQFRALSCFRRAVSTSIAIKEKKFDCQALCQTIFIDHRDTATSCLISSLPVGPPPFATCSPAPTADRFTHSLLNNGPFRIYSHTHQNPVFHFPIRPLFSTDTHTLSLTHTHNAARRRNQMTETKVWLEGEDHLESAAAASGTTWLLGGLLCTISYGILLLVVITWKFDGGSLTMSMHPPLPFNPLVAAAQIPSLHT